MKTVKRVIKREAAVDEIEAEADRIATKEYLSQGRFGGVSKASGGIIVSRKFFDFDEAKRKAVVYLKSIGFGVKKV